MIYLDNSAILRALTLTKAMYFQKRCSQTLTDLHDLARIYRGLCLFVFFHWTTTDKIEFTDWSQVNQKFGCREIAIF